MDTSSFYQTDEHGFAAMSHATRFGVDILSKLPIQSVVDVGGGSGNFLAELKKRCVQPGLTRVLGIDVNENCIAESNKRGIPAVACDITKTIPEGTEGVFDAAFSGSTFEHIFDTDQFLVNIGRMLKPGGYFMLTVPNLGSWYNRIMLLFGYQPVFTEVSIKENAGHIMKFPGKPGGHIRAYTRRALEELFVRNGYRIVKTYGLGFDTEDGLKSRTLTKVCNALIGWWTSGAGTLCVLAQKK